MTTKTLFYTASEPHFKRAIKDSSHSNEAKLNATFQVWARRFGVTDESSLALLVCGDEEEENRYFKLGKHVVEPLAKNAIDKIDWSQLPEDFAGVDVYAR